MWTPAEQAPVRHRLEYNQIAKRVNSRGSTPQMSRLCSGSVSPFSDIRNNIETQLSTGYQRWATIENLKRAAATTNRLTEHGIGSYQATVAFPSSESAPGKACGIQNSQSLT